MVIGCRITSLPVVSDIVVLFAPLLLALAVVFAIGAVTAWRASERQGA